MSGKQYCDKCGITTDCFKAFQKHILTEKHQNNSLNEPHQGRYKCKHCAKTYTSTVGLWKHNKKHSAVILNQPIVAPIIDPMNYHLIQEIKNLVRSETVIECTLSKIQYDNKQLKNENIKLKKLIVDLSSAI